MRRALVALARAELRQRLRRLQARRRQLDRVQRDGPLHLGGAEAQVLAGGGRRALDLLMRRLLVLVAPAPVLPAPRAAHEAQTLSSAPLPERLPAPRRRERPRGVLLAVAMVTRATTVQITMPAMGESVTEGTVLEWLKAVGDRVEADEPLVEISTDKVDAEVPAPASGTLTKILVEADSTVSVGDVLGEIEAGEGDSAPAAPEPDGEADARGRDLPADGRLGERGHRARVAQAGGRRGGRRGDAGGDLHGQGRRRGARARGGHGGRDPGRARRHRGGGLGAVPDRGRSDPGGSAGARAERRAGRGASRHRPRARRQRRPERHARGAAHRRRARHRRGRAERLRPARARDQGRRAGRRGRQRRRRPEARDRRHGSAGRRGQAHPRPGGHAGALHEREPRHPHGHQLPQRARGHAGARAARRSRAPGRSSPTRT